MLDGIHPLPGAAEKLVNDAAEMSLLGALLVKPALLAAVPPCFDPSHYGRRDHGDIHRALLTVAQPGVPAAAAVRQVLGVGDRHWNERIAALLVAPVALLPGMVAQYAELVTDLHRRRRLLAMTEIIREGVFASGPAAGADAVAMRTMAELEDLLAGHEPQRVAATLNEAMDQAMAEMDAAAAREGPAGVSTGFAGLDARLGGMEPGHLVVMAGRPAMGKSALGHQIALNVARAGHHVTEFSLEMSRTQLARRALAAASGVPLWAMQQGKHAQYADRIRAARKELHDLPITIEDGGGLTAATIALKARQMRRRHGLGLILVDHLHIVRPEDVDVRQGATWAIGRVSGAMKRLAKECECPVLLLAQLNRGVEGREDKRPNLSDLRQAGEIEQDADAVAFIYRAEYYMRHPPEQGTSETREAHANKLARWQQAKEAAAGKAEVILAKVRDGSPGTVPMTFCGETTSFGDSAP